MIHCAAFALWGLAEAVWCSAAHVIGRLLGVARPSCETRLTPQDLAASRMPTAAAGFRPHPGLRGPLAQTCWQVTLRPFLARRRLRVRAHVLAPDGQPLALDLFPPPSSQTQSGRGVLLLCHGIAGSWRSRSLGPWAELADELGMECAVWTRRGHPGASALSPGALPSSWCDVDDARAVVAYLSRLRPGEPVAAVGLSAGAPALVRLAARSPPGNLAAVVAFGMAPDLVAQAAHVRARGGWLDRLLGEQARGLYCSRRATTLTEADDAVARELGHASAADYHASASVAGDLGNAHVPLLLLHSRDDPIVEPGAADVLEAAAAAAPETVVAVVTSHGGHLGHVDASGRCWATRVAQEFIGTALGSRLGSGSTDVAGRVRVRGHTPTTTTSHSPNSRITSRRSGACAPASS